MEGSKILKMFKSLTTEEWKYLRWFVQSNFFNTDPNLLRLYEALAKHHPAFASKSLTKELLYAKVFGGQAYHDGKWRNLVSKMNKLLEDYLIWLELENEPITRQKLLTKAFGRRNLYEQFEKSTNELSEKLVQQGEQSAEALQERAQINLQYYHHPKSVKVSNLGRLQAVMDDLDHYYFAEKLRIASELKVFENIVTGAAAIRLKKEVQSLVGAGKLRQLPYLELYHRILEQLEQAAGLEQFQATFEFFSSIYARLSDTDRQFGLLQLLNFAINQVNSGEGAYRKLVMELYKLGLQEGVLIIDGRISENSFVNIVSTGSFQKEYGWVGQFIKNYQDCLEPSVRKDVLTLSLGLWHFHQQQYSQTIDLLTNYSFETIENNLTSKNLLFRCYFMLLQKDNSYYTLFQSYASAFGKYIAREKKLSVSRKGWHKNFVGMVVKIARLKQNGTFDSDARRKIAEEVSKKSMILKNWVIYIIETN